MKMKYLLLSFAAMLLPLTFTACDDSSSDDNIENNGENNDNNEEEDAAPLQISIAADPLYDNFELTITNVGGLDLYYVDIVSSETFVSICLDDADEAAAYAWDWRYGDTTVEDYSATVGYTGVPIFNNSESVSYSAADYVKLDPSTTYYVVACGITSTGEIDSAATALAVTTAEMDEILEVDFTIAPVEDFRADNFMVNVTPSNDDINYIVGVYPKTAFDATEGYFLDSDGNPDYAAAAADWSATLGDWYGVSDPSDEDSAVVSADYSVADGISVFKGAATVNMLITSGSATIKPETNYVVIAFGINSNGYIISTITNQEVTTGKAVEAELSFTIEETSDPEQCSVWGEGYYAGEIRVTPSNDTDKYAYAMLYGDINGLTDQEIWDANTIYMMPAAMTAAAGSQTITYMGMDSTFTLVVFGYNGGRTTDMTRYEVVLP